MIDPAPARVPDGPLALVAILLLMHFDYITHESAWLWLGVFVAVPTATSSSTASTTGGRAPSRSTYGWPPRWRPSPPSST